MEVFDENNTQVQLCLVMKMLQLQRESFPNITYHDVETILKRTVWRKESPRSLHEAVDDVLSLTSEEVVRYLSRLAMEAGRYQELSDFNDLIGGSKYE